MIMLGGTQEMAYLRSTTRLMHECIFQQSSSQIRLWLRAHQVGQTGNILRCAQNTALYAVPKAYDCVKWNLAWITVFVKQMDNVMPSEVIPTRKLVGTFSALIKIVMQLHRDKAEVRFCSVLIRGLASFRRARHRNQVKKFQDSSRSVYNLMPETWSSLF